MKGETLRLAVADIGELPPKEYVGLIDDTAIKSLMVRLAADGLLTPIWVRRNENAAGRRWSVIAGRHRLRAAAQLDWEVIDAVQVADENSRAGELRRLQLIENLDRRALRPIEFACFIMERWGQVAAGRLPAVHASQQSRAARARWHAFASVANAADIDAETAARSGWSVRTVQRYRALHAAIVIALPEIAERAGDAGWRELPHNLNFHPLGENCSAMEKLAGFPEAKRLAATKAILADPDCNSLKQVLVKAGVEDSNGNRVDPDRPDAVILDAWTKMKPSGRRAHVAWVAKAATPKLAKHMIAILKERNLL